MLLSLLISYMKATIKNADNLVDFTTQNETVVNEDDESEEPVVQVDDKPEDVHIHVATDKNGEIVECNQIHHYIYRVSTLDDMCFYDFCCCVCLQSKEKSKDTKNTPETRLGVLHWHGLLEKHPLSDTHELLEHTNESHSEGTHEYVPRVVGMSIPHCMNLALWALFALAHFKPFSSTHPLILPGSSVVDVFNTYSFSPRNLAIMQHWEAVHECEDERDAECLRRRAQLTTMKRHPPISPPEIDNDDYVPRITPLCRSTAEEFKVNQFVLLLKQSCWLTENEDSGMVTSRQNDLHDNLIDVNLRSVDIDCSPSQLTKWMSEICKQETVIVENRWNTLNPDLQMEWSHVKEISSFEFPSIPSCPPYLMQFSCAPAEQLTPSAVINQIGDEFRLNEKQWIAFCIICQHFMDKFIEKRAETCPSLTMLMTGPGGMGKTHVVKAVWAVMEYYGYGHIIRFLAPTGSAATLIDGMMIHKGLGIKIKATNKGKGNCAPGENKEDYSVSVSNQCKTQLWEEWKNVAFLLVDETSLLGLQLLAQFDHALCVAKECPDLWFGGIALILSSDFFQYPPVGGTALYTPISCYAGQTDDEVQRRLGCLAWKTINMVVTLTEQQCMKGDSAYGEAVSRLRVRQCTYEDME
jgi:hypothetical protein